MLPCILVPFDFSPAAKSALRWAADLQRAVGGGTIHPPDAAQVAK